MRQTNIRERFNLHESQQFKPQRLLEIFIPRTCLKMISHKYINAIKETAALQMRKVKVITHIIWLGQDMGICEGQQPTVYEKSI